MIDMTVEQKFQVLMAELQERYDSSHKIRDRSTQFTLWISGMAIGLAWLLVSEASLAVPQRLALTLLAAVLYLGALFLVRALQRGSCRNREAMIRVERALGMHEKGYYLPDAVLLPDQYGQTARKWSHDSCTLPIWLTLVATTLVILIWTTPCRQKQQRDQPQPQQSTGGNSHG
jgi:hypothetical protein